MKLRSRLFFQPHPTLCLCALLFGSLAPQTLVAESAATSIKEYQPTNGEFDAVGKAVVELLQTRDSARFATNMSVSAENWLSLLSTNMPLREQEQIKTFATNAHYGLRKMETNAQALVARAESLHLDFSKSHLSFHVIMPKHIGEILDSSVAGARSQPYLETLEIVLTPDPSANHQTNGDFRVVLGKLEKLPGGWRSFDNVVQWASFPANVVDEKTRRELALLEKVAFYKSFSSQDDPALSTLGETLVRFIRERDTGIYEKELLMNSDLVWAVFQKSGQQGPSRKEFDEQVGKQVQQQVDIARQTIKLMEDAGIDLKAADIQIKEAAVEQGQLRGASGSLDNLMGSQFTLTLAVKTDGKARNGTSLSGDYVLGIRTIMRFGGDWKAWDDVHWEKLPDGVVDTNTAAAVEFENYVARYRALPPGTVAPEIEFTTLAGEKKMKLSDLRGKVVVLDFWATWCGACQEPMADLQKIRDGHPNWQDKVAIVPLSIDDTLEIVRKHVDNRGWTNTFNVWAGDGGWRSAAATTFRVTAVPTTYVIDPQGKIVMTGFPVGLPIARTIDGLLTH
ncbi:MAG: thioredoxin-like domain-containing protein [Verrucomicrobiia bacterium]|jgi:thiol-disulfide isomerase/thioredoxin